MICKRCKKDQNIQEFIGKNNKIRVYCKTCTEKIKDKRVKCIEPGCTIQAIFNKVGEKKGIYCAAHKKPGMIDVKNKKCAEVDCTTRPNYNKPGEKKGIYCVVHKKPGMINVTHRTCIKPGCNIQPVYNKPGETEGLYCAAHKKSGMIDVKSKRCLEAGCFTQPHYNKPGETQGLYCAAHKKPGMIDVKNKKCAEFSCNIQPHYNKPGETEGLYCAAHKKSGMIDVINKTCVEPDCNIQPHYNKPGETEGLYCAAHKKSGMIDILHKKCIEIGCNVRPIYNKPGETEGLYCAAHKKSGMIDVINKTCVEPNCKSRPVYGIPTNLPIYCSNHKKATMIKEPTKRCNTERCKNIAIYGINFSVHCEEHKEKDEILLVERQCKDCKRIDILSSNELCVHFCEKDKEFEQYKKYQKRKQLRVQQILTEKIGKPDKIEESIDTDCGRERVDFMYECKTHNIGIEPDENQHKYNCELGEFNRMKNIFFALGQDAPLIFIRYNPDNYRVNGVLQKISQSKKEDELIRWVKHYMENIPEDICSVLYLFYDEYSQENVKIFPFDPYDTRTFCCDKCDEMFYIESMFNDHKC